MNARLAAAAAAPCAPSWPPERRQGGPAPRQVRARPGQPQGLLRKGNLRSASPAINNRPWSGKPISAVWVGRAGKAGVVPIPTRAPTLPAHDLPLPPLFFGFFLLLSLFAFFFLFFFLSISRFFFFFIKSKIFNPTIQPLTLTINNNNLLLFVKGSNNPSSVH